MKYLGGDPCDGVPRAILTFKGDYLNSPGGILNSITDYIVATALLYYIIRGFCRGFLGTLLGPISLIIGVLASYFYYSLNQNFILCLLISIAGPFIIHLFLSLTLKFWHKTIHRDESISLMSRFSGACMSLLWSGGILILALILVSFIPGNIVGFRSIQKNVLGSRSYAIIKKLLEDTLPLDKNVPAAREITDLFQNPAQMDALRSDEEFKDILNDDKIARLLSDEETRQDLQNKNIAKLLSNPAMQDVLKDKDLLKNLFALQKKLIHEGMENAENSK